MSPEGTTGAANQRQRFGSRLRVWAAALAVFAVGAGAAVPLSAGTAAAAPRAGAAYTDASGHGHSGAPAGDRAHRGDPGSHGRGWGPDGRADVNLRGMVQQLASDQLVLTSTASTGPDHVKGTVTVAIGTATRYREPGIREGGLSAIVQGDVVAVRAKRDSSGNLQALEVTLPEVRAKGLVATSVAGSFTLTGTGTTLGRAWGGSDLTVNVSASTRYVQPESDRRGAPKSAPVPLALGSKVTVVGTQDGYATLNALRVLVFPGNHAAGRGHGDANHGNAKKGRGDAGRLGSTSGRGHPGRDS